MQSLQFSPFLNFLQSSWSSMRICSTSQGFGPTWQRLPVAPPQPSWACPRTFTTPSESWPWITSATVTRANLPTSIGRTLQVNIQKSRKILQKFKKYYTLLFIFYTFLAPDQNPADVKGLGTEPGNLVISWTVSLELCKKKKKKNWFVLFSSKGW